MSARQNSSVNTRATRSIQRAFLALLEKKPVSQITILQLAREADINKSTFYRYYSDIYDLYDEMLDNIVTEKLNDLDYYSLIFTDADLFIKKFLEDLKSDTTWWHTFLQLLHGTVPMDTLGTIMSKALYPKFYEDGLLVPSAENDEKINFFVILMGFSLYFYPDETPDCIMQSIVAATRTLFA